MAWRVSWAALCRFASCARPVPHNRKVPRNRQAAPIETRCEIEKEEEIVLVVMSPSVETRSSIGRGCPACSAGLLTCGSIGLMRLPGFPVTLHRPCRSQLRGQSRFQPRLGHPHRVPYYASGRLAHEAPNSLFLAGGAGLRQPESDSQQPYLPRDKNTGRQTGFVNWKVTPIGVNASFSALFGLVAKSSRKEIALIQYQEANSASQTISTARALL
jgi:hypothetical protein